MSDELKKGQGAEEDELFESAADYAEWWQAEFRGGWYEATSAQKIPGGPETGWLVILVNRGMERSEDDEKEVIVWLDPEEGYYADDPDRRGYEEEVRRLRAKLAGKGENELQQAAAAIEEAFGDRAAWGVETGDGGTIHLGIGERIEAADLEQVAAVLGRHGYALADWRIEIVDGSLFWHVTARTTV